uniref:Large ribosomal subunit protein bL32c n=1 Tax=Galaxaura rugosa TaxID=268570 RepID=A0A1G4NSN7_9FLOR|nr:Ribosomal protein L32 [Galaxaura rugosa]SCW21670.1 Ribosomal protein L32 [Galaxaura rugosa]
MAVPKKRTSKSKSRSHKANWKRKTYYSSKKAISLGKSILTGKSNSFIYLNTESNSIAID